MAFFEKLRRAFGLDESVDYDDEIDGIDATVTPLRQRQEENRQAVAPSSSEPIHAHEQRLPATSEGALADSPRPEATTAKPAEPHKTVPETAVVSDDGEVSVSEGAVPAEIFRTVVAIFNRSLPDFLGSSVDTDRQEQYLYNALEKGMKGYLDSLDMQARRRYQEQRQNDMLKVEAELQQLRESLRVKEEDSNEARRLQLSAERQKRALSERVHDLEKQIASMEAEAEQLDLENKSMVNKLRLAEMHEKDLQAVRAEDAERNATIEALKAENKALSEQLEQLQLKGSLGETMVNDLQTRASEALKALADKEAALAAMAADLHKLQTESEADASALRLEADTARRNAAAAEQSITSLKEQVEELHQKADELSAARDEAAAKAETLTAQLAKSREKLAVVSEIQVQVEQLEEAQLKSDALMRRQKDELLEKDELLRSKDSDLRDKNMALAQKDSNIKRLEDLADSLRRQMEDAAYEHSQTESTLRMEINRLKNLQSAQLQEAADDMPTAKADVKVDPVSAKPAEEPAEDKAPEAPSAPAQAIDYMLEDLPIVEKNASEPAPARRSRKPSKSKAAAADELKIEKPKPAEQKPAAAPADDFDALDTDWLVSSPAPSKKQVRRNEPADTDDFGYHEPPRNPTPDNPAQMSLF